MRALLVTLLATLYIAVILILISIDTSIILVLISLNTILKNASLLSIRNYFYL